MRLIENTTTNADYQMAINSWRMEMYNTYAKANSGVAKSPITTEKDITGYMYLGVKNSKHTNRSKITNDTPVKLPDIPDFDSELGPTQNAIDIEIKYASVCIITHSDINKADIRTKNQMRNTRS